MKTALVLGGGGSKGAYEIGVWKALREEHIIFDIVTGTSIGALIGAMVVQDEYDKCYELWCHLCVDDVVKGGINMDLDLELLMSQKGRYKTLLTTFINNKGADISPFIHMIEQMFDNEKFFSSAMDFGCMSVNITQMKPWPIRKQDMTPENAKDYLLASASCFPAFPLKKIGDDFYADGGYYDNVPIQLARDMGADRVIAVDLKSIGRNIIKEPEEQLLYIEPHVPLGSFLLFDEKTIRRNMQLGYLDAKKKLKRYLGYIYTFDKKSRSDIVSFEGFVKSYIKQLNITISQPSIQRVYQKILMHELKGKLKPYELHRFKYLRLLESCAFVFRVDDLKIYTFSDFVEITLQCVNAYQPVYESIHSDMGIKDIGRELSHLSHRDIIYYLYEQISEKSPDDVKYLALMFMEQFLMALILHILKQKGDVV